MANALYNGGREGILDESVRIKSGDIRVMLVKAAYRFNADHRVITDLGAVDVAQLRTWHGQQQH